MGSTITGGGDVNYLQIYKNIPTNLHELEVFTPPDKVHGISPYFTFTLCWLLRQIYATDKRSHIGQCQLLYQRVPVLVEIPA